MSEEFEGFSLAFFTVNEEEDYASPREPTRKQRFVRWWHGWFWAEPGECWGGPVVWVVGLGFWTLAYREGPGGRNIE